MSCFVVPDFHVDVLVSWASLRGAPAFIEGLPGYDDAAWSLDEGVAA